MYRLGLRFCGRHEDAQDLVQETFLQAHRKWHQFKGQAAPKTWLFTIAARVCGRMRRKRAGQPSQMESLDELLPFGETRLAAMAGHGDDPARHLSRRELREHLEHAISDLPPEFRVPLILKDILDLPLDDVAGILGVKLETVKTRLHRARLRIRKILVAELPARRGPPPAYARQVCLDLLQAKQDALDRGAAFRVGQNVMCERCRSVFASLDLGHDLCRRLGTGGLPADVKRALLARLRDERLATSGRPAKKV